MDFGSLITAMVTPFTPNGKVDYNKSQELAEYLYQNGSDSLVIAGTTGESPTLSKEEKLKLFAAVAEMSAGRGSVIAGTSSYDTAASVELTKAACKQGVDGILAVVPYYNKPPQEGLYQHFSAIAAAAGDLPVILYNIPGRTGINMTSATVARLAAIDNIIGIKEASGSMDQTSEIKSLVADDFVLYSGDDSLTLPLLALGARGVISVASNFIGNQLKDMLDTFVSGNIPAATKKHLELLQIFKTLFITANPIPVKYCMNRLGLPAGPCRLPLTEPTVQEKQVLDAMLKKYGMME